MYKIKSFPNSFKSKFRENDPPESKPKSKNK